jgi:hypothetical protein
VGSSSDFAATTRREATADSGSSGRVNDG